MQPGVGTIPAQYACPYVRGRVQVVQARETLADEINALREREEQQQSSHSQARAVFRREFRGEAPMAREMAFGSATAAGKGGRFEPVAYYAGGECAAHGRGE